MGGCVSSQNEPGDLASCAPSPHPQNHPNPQISKHEAKPQQIDSSSHGSSIASQPFQLKERSKSKENQMEGERKRQAECRRQDHPNAQVDELRTIIAELIRKSKKGPIVLTNPNQQRAPPCGGAGSAADENVDSCQGKRLEIRFCLRAS